MPLLDVQAAIAKAPTLLGQFHQLGLQIGLLEKVENLLFGKMLFHCCFLLGKRTLLSLNWY
ncbi:hypothetical protein A7R81_26515 [Pseudomonas aeruginosa]|nr:hypothetical protein A7R81_26515 [Pseudomonas aeruginosa]